MVDKLISLPLSLPGSIAPPLMTTAGRFTRKAPINIPGTILSQFGTSTKPSNPCALAMVSTLSAINSRDAKEYFIPICPMAIPSHTPMLGTMIGVPPAMRIPAFTASLILSKCKCPGTISLYALTTPIKGRFNSSSVNPKA